MSELPTRAEVRASTAAAKKPMSTTKKALIAACSLLGVLVLAVAGVFLGIRHSIDSQIRHVQIDTEQSRPAPAQSAASGDDINFLILGSDSRQSGGDPTDWQAGAQRSDVMMLVQITGDRKGINIMSIPRDSWVDIPGHGTAKINAAYSYGGADLTIQTVQQLTGVTVDHFMVTDFSSFEELTDILGGVEIASREDGVKTYTGEQALRFVRERYSLPRGDFDRMRRQQAWMRAIMQKTFDQEVLTDVPKLSSMLTALLEHSAVDQTLGFDSMLSLATELTAIRSGSVSFFTAPFTGTGTSEDGQSIVNLDAERLADLMAAWREDSVKNYLVTHTDSIDVLGSDPVV